MRFTPIEPPRRYEVASVVVHDCGRIELDPGEQVTIVTAAGAEHDVARKAWGFYATSSLNARLPGFGLRGVLVRNEAGRGYVLLVESGREAEFEEYLTAQGIRTVSWLDDEGLDRLERALTPVRGRCSRLRRMFFRSGVQR